MLVIGIFGVGVVGTGALHILKYQPHIKVKKALVKDRNKLREGISESIEFVDSINDIIKDSVINCIVEVIGGTTLAWEIIQEAIKHNKHVVTANKALISKYVKDIQCLLKEHPQVQFKYDASVCGGIPIIPALKRISRCDSVNSVIGIMNGTCNYILTRMFKENKEYTEILFDAQKEGFAEADPTNDVQGYDTRSKLCILAKLAFGCSLDENQVQCCGISQISQDDVNYAKMLNRTIKLLGKAETQYGNDGQPILVVHVFPTMLPQTNPLAHIDGAMNAVSLKSKNLGSSAFIGPGAGRYPTANSIVADILEVHELFSINKTGNHDTFGYFESTNLQLATDYISRFYLRLVVRDCVGIIKEISTILANHSIMIHSILQIPILNYNRVPFAIITEECLYSSVQTVCNEINNRRQTDLDYILYPILCLQYIEDEKVNP